MKLFALTQGDRLGAQECRVSFIFEWELPDHIPEPGAYPELENYFLEQMSQPSTRAIVKNIHLGIWYPSSYCMMDSFPIDPHFKGMICKHVATSKLICFKVFADIWPTSVITEWCTVDGTALTAHDTMAAVAALEELKTYSQLELALWAEN